jgi:hypothetical protein
VNLINTDIKPDPYDPQTGDVYEYGEFFVQRLVVEDAPTSEDHRIRYRIDGGSDSNLTSVGQFHRHLAGLTNLRGVGRVREYSPLEPGDTVRLMRVLKATAMGVDKPAAAYMIAELRAMLQTVHDTLEAHSTANGGTTLEMLADLVKRTSSVESGGACTKDRERLSENERDELYMWRDGAAAEKKRAVERDAAFHRGTIEARQLGDIIEHLWVAIEDATGKTGLERDLINAATMKAELERSISAVRNALRIPTNATPKETVARAEHLAHLEARTRIAITADIEAHATVSKLKEALRIPGFSDEDAVEWASQLADAAPDIRRVVSDAPTLAASLANMQISEQVEALEVMGIDPMRALQLAEALDPRRHQLAVLRERVASLQNSEADLNAVRSAFLDATGTNGTIAEIVGAIRNSSERLSRLQLELRACDEDRSRLQVELDLRMERDEAERLDRSVKLAWMQESPSCPIDDSPSIRCWPKTGVVLAGSEGPVLTVIPEGGGNVAIVHMEDVAAWLAARFEVK